MNKLAQNLFQVIFPFYPFWAWIAMAYIHFPADKMLVFLLLPMVVYIIWNYRPRVPTYLVFFILFTIYHLGSVFKNHLMPANTNPPLFILSDFNVLACLLFFVVENTEFDDEFITKMNRNILIVVLISLVVSIIQIKSPTFFFNTDIDGEDLSYTSENRNASIYSWTGANSVGVTFPIMIAILVSVFDFKSKPFPYITLSGVVVAFLTRARFVMIATILAFMQLLLVKTIPLKRKLSVIGFFTIGIIAFIGISQMAGFDINKVIDERILEKSNEMGSAKSRIVSYEVFMKKFPEHPYFGVGPKTRDDVVDLLDGNAFIIHVGYLSYLYYYGSIGASLFFLGLIFLLYELWKAGRNHDFWGSFYGVLAFALSNISLVYFNINEMGIILAVIYVRYYNVQAERLYE